MVPARLTIVLLATLALALAPGGETRAAGGGDVLVVGDSLGVGTEPYLSEELAGTVVRTDAEVSRPSAAGLAVLSANLSASDRVVVFALGTNDDPAAPDALAANLAEARAIAGDRCLVVASVSRPPLSGVSDDGLNSAIRRFATSTPGVQLVDWEGAVDANPALLTDGVHATPDGYALRAALFAEAIRACATSAATDQLPTGDGIPNPDRDALAEGRKRTRREPPEREREPVSRRESLRILADALSGQIAIGALR